MKESRGPGSKKYVFSLKTIQLLFRDGLHQEAERVLNCGPRAVSSGDHEWERSQPS